MWFEVRRDVIVVEGLHVPEELQKQGFTSDALTRHLVDRLREIDPGVARRDSVRQVEASAVGTDSTRPRGEAAPRERFSRQDGLQVLTGQAGSRGFMLSSEVDAANFEIPKSGVSKATLVHLVREALAKHPVRISGEVQGDTQRLVVTMRVVDRRAGAFSVDTFHTRPRDLETTLRLAARVLMRHTQPEVLAAFLYSVHRDSALPAVLDCLNNDSQTDDPVAYNLLGILHYDSGEYGRALDMFDEAISHDPRYAPAHLNRGNTLVRLKRLDEAVAAYRHAAAIPGVEQGSAYNAWGVALDLRNRPQEALGTYALAVRADPGSAVVYLNRGKALARLGRYAEAIRDYRRAAERDSGNASVMVAWGNAFLGMENLDSAVVRFAEALRLDPASVDAHRGWGNALRYLGRTDEAIERYRAAARFDSTDVLTYLEWGDALRFAGRWNEALAVYSRAMDTDPTHPHPYVGMGLTHADQGRYPEAATWLEQAVERDSTQAFIFDYLCSVQLSARFLRNAARSCERATRLDPAAVGPLASRGLVWLALGNTRLAIHHARRAHRLYPDDLFTRMLLGDAYRVRSDPARAEAYIDGVLEQDSSYASGYTGLGDVSMLRGDFAGAERWYREALRRDSALSDPLVGLGASLWRQGAHDEATRALCQALQTYSWYAWAYMELGWSLAERGRRDEAAWHFQEAIHTDPEAAIAWEAAAELRALGLPARRGRHVHPVPPPACRAGGGAGAPVQVVGAR